MLEFIIWYLLSFPATWFLVFSIEKFISLEIQVAKKVFAGIGEKIIYSAIVLFVGGLYDLFNNSSFDGFLLFISFPVGWLGVFLVELSTNKGE